MKCDTCFFKDTDTECFAESPGNVKLCDLAAKDKKYRDFVIEKTLDLDTPKPVDQGPGIVNKVINYGVAVVKRVLDGSRDVIPEVHQQRLATCYKCDHCNLAKPRQCLICGCDVEKKTLWASEECPVGKWPRENSPEIPHKASVKEIPTPAPSQQSNSSQSNVGGCGCNFLPKEV